MIEIQNTGSHLANRCKSSDTNTIQSEVVRPLVNARIEETAKSLRLRHNRSDVAPFVAIAVRTRIGKITLMSRTSMLLANNVIYLTTKVGILFANQAIFTQVLGTCPNQLS